MQLVERILGIFTRLKLQLTNLNVFPSIPPSNDPHVLQNQRISTRLFISSLITALTILLLYNSLAVVNKTFTVQKPTYDKYLYLYAEYSNNLQCPCNKISNTYDRFLQLNYTLHGVCSSFLVSEQWVQYLVNTRFTGRTTTNNFRIVGPPTFQALRSFCRLADQSIENGLISFYATEYVSAYLTASDLFHKQNEAQIKRFISSTTDTFLLSLQLIRETTQSNALLSGEGTNAFPSISTVPGALEFSPTIYFYTRCRCDQTPLCFAPATTYILSTVPGFYGGCYRVEALLRTNLECFYDQQCFDNVKKYINSTLTINATVLDSSLSTKFTINATVGNMLNELMVEKWNSIDSFEKYYNECEPNQCTYTIETRNDIIYIVTTVIGLIGGLVAILRLIIPRLTVYVRSRKQYTTGKTVISMKHRLVILWKNAKTKFSEFNMFSATPPSNDPYVLRYETIATRLFILSLITVTTILILYNSLVVANKTFTINKPTFDKYLNLYAEHSNNLQCPCNKISITYDTFLQLNYTLHNACSSFLISKGWVQYLISLNYRSVLQSDDFRSFSRYTFQALRSFCRLADDTIKNSLTNFYSNEYLSAFPTAPDLFHIQNEAQIKQFVSSIIDRFLLSLQLIRQTTQSNALFPLQLSKYSIYVLVTPGYANSFPRSYGGCSCAETSLCFGPAVIYNEFRNSTLFTVPGFYIGCYIIDALLHSTLECFYDQQCLNNVQFYVNSTLAMNATVLDASSSTKFTMNTTVGNMLNELMVEKWNSTDSFEKYYNECAPSQCTYTIETRNDIIYIVTTVIGLIGGLVKVLKVCLPCFVFCFMKLLRYKEQRIGFHGTNNFSVFWNSSKQYLCNINIFPSVPPSTDLRTLKDQRLSTRLFILSLIAAVTILLLYNSLAVVNKTFTVQKPTFDKYLYLYAEYSNNLLCPCNKISNTYGRFLQLNYTLHGVCSSFLVSEQWVQYLVRTNFTGRTTTKDFRTVGPPTFQALRSFCRLADQSIENGLISFYATDYVSAYLTPPKLFQSQSEAQINRFISSTTDTFLISLDLVRETTQINRLFTAIMTSFVIMCESSPLSAFYLPSVYTGCSCAQTPLCFGPAAIYNEFRNSTLFTVPGFYIGCYIIDALLHSTLECFYDQQCLNNVQFYVNSTLAMNATVLDASSSTKFTMNTTVGNMLNELMVEKWNSTDSFEKYYNECAPSQCTYTIETRNDVIYVLTTVIGLIGGLVTVLKLIVRRMVNLLMKCIRKRNGTIEPEVATTEDKPMEVVDVDS